MSRLTTAAFLVFFAVTCLLMFPVAVGIWLVTLPFDRRRVALHRFTSWWACLYLAVMPGWRVETRGRRKIDPGKAYVVIANHQSQLDILVVFRLIFHFKFVSKKEVFRIPIVGWNMRLNRYIEIDRGNRESARRMFADCETHLAEGSSVLFFPEGTRSTTDELRPFKHGAFRLAHSMEAPLLPVAISGTREALPKHGRDFGGRHRIVVEVLDEIPYATFADLTIDETAVEARRVLQEAVHRLEASSDDS